MRFSKLITKTANNTRSRITLLMLLMLLSSIPAHATFPGRNGLIAFQAQTDNGVQIFTVRPNGHDLRQITFVSDDAVAPDWSPDGKQIVFEIDRADASSCGAGIAIMNADGSNIVLGRKQDRFTKKLALQISLNETSPPPSQEGSSSIAPPIAGIFFVGDFRPQQLWLIRKPAPRLHFLVLHQKA